MEKLTNKSGIILREAENIPPHLSDGQLRSEY